MIEFTIPLTPVLIAAAIGGAITMFFMIVVIHNVNSHIQRARHNHMANIIHQLRQRHDDWKDVPADTYESQGWIDRATRWVFRKHRFPGGDPS